MTTFTINNSRFDVVEYIKNLRKANFTQDQAEAIAQETEHFIDNTLKQTKQEAKDLFDNKELATKGNIRKLELKLQKNIRELELKTQKEIALIKSKLLKWMLGIGMTSIILVISSTFTILKLMLRI
jgi:hypothetical protein